ncbi:MAG: hypothetical protein V1921_06690 [Candidatus Altiarchaeota archaeon]
MTGTKVVKLKLEDDGREKLPPLKEDSIVAHVVEVYGQREYRGRFTEIAEYYDNLLEDIEGLDVRPRQLQRIYDTLEETYPKEPKHVNKLGIFLTALIQKSTSEEFELKVRKPLGHLGYLLKGGKKITVSGNLGEAAGHCMKDGKLIVKGNTGDTTGWGLEGGEIILEGNAGKNTAHGMKGGTLHIRGNSGIWTATAMEGGILKVDGKIKEISDDYRSGEIWEGNVRRRPK